MKKLTALFAQFILFSTCGFSQQIVRGTVVDKETKYPLIGVNITIELPSGELLGAATDLDGLYRIENVPYGRQTVKATYLGYMDVAIGNIIVSSGKEVILDLQMEENIEELAEVVVTARRNGEVLNEMATVSAREFSVQETNRYAGSRGEPARMASNFAGVQGADDSRNDIVIRGNTPGGVLWRLDGVNIPNPNHFNIPGTSGGPVTILNNKFLANSDFFTGAFPAEYGNGIAGVFDLKMRNGNNEKQEFSAQLGFLGTEVMAEGPISKENRSSYLVMYRYSTLQLFGFLGIDIGSDAVPNYQDGAFRLNFPGKKGSNLAVFGMGGISTIDIVLSEQEKPDESYLFGQNDRDQYFDSDMGVVGVSYTKPVNPNTFFKITMAASHSNVDANHDQIFRHLEQNPEIPDEEIFVVDSLPYILDYYFRVNKYSAYATLNKKLNKQTTLKAGLNADLYDMFFRDSARTVVPQTDGSPAKLDPWMIRWDTKGKAILLQPFIQLKHRFTEKLTGTAGLTALYFSINDNSFSPFEPRLGISYQIDERQKLSFGTGLHSQIQSPYIYYYSKDNPTGRDPLEYNTDMGLTKSAHMVLAYDRLLGTNLRMKVETYYQHLYEIPIDAMLSSSFSLVNAGSGFSRFFPNELTNDGTGRNYGLEFTLEKFFSRGHYFLFSGSLFDSKYQGSDGVLRNTTFNGKYAFNALFAKEITFKNESALSFGGKVTLVGGRWYGPVDEEATFQQLEIIYQDDEVNTIQFEDYFRADAKINYRINAKKVSHEFAIDLVNIFDTKNILTLNFAPEHPSGDAIQKQYQLGFLPIFYYKVDF